MDLGQHLKTPSRDNTTAGNEQSALKSESTEAPASDKAGTQSQEHHAAPGAGTTDDGKPFDEEQPEAEFENLVKQFEDADDPIELAKMIVQTYNVGRIFIVPNLYFKLMYPGQEAYDLKTVIDKSVENEKKNLAPTTDFNDYEKRLYTKLPVLRKAQEESPWTQQEMDIEAKYLGRYIAKMTVAVFLARYMWILYPIYLEMKHAQPIIAQKGPDFFNNSLDNKLGLKK